MTKRIHKWDNIKALLIFLVVFGHFINSYIKAGEIFRSCYIFIYFFHMPLFIFVSGLFAKSTVDKNKNDKLAGFLLLHIVLKFVLAVSKYIYFGSFSFSLLREKNFPWYMLAMVFYPIIIRRLKNFKPAWVFTASIFLSLLIGFDKSISDFLIISRLIVFFPFYYLGYLLKSEDIIKITQNKNLKIACAVIFAVFTLAVFISGDLIYPIRPFLSGQNPYSGTKVALFLGPFVRFAFYIAAFLISFCVIVLTPEKSPREFMAYFGQRTLPIYCFHIFIMQIILYAFNLHDWLKTLPTPVMLIIVFLLSAAITAICSLSPFMKTVTWICDLPKKMIKEQPSEKNI